MSLRRRRGVAVLLGLSAALRVAGGQPPVVRIDPLEPGKLIPNVKLSRVSTPPVHGELHESPSGIWFEPTQSFWALGVDSLVYETDDGRAVTLVLAGAGNDGSLSYDFEPNSPLWPRNGGGARLTFTPEAALEGQVGGRLTSGPLPDFLQVGVPYDGDNGAAHQGTGSGIKIRLPVGNGGSGLAEGFVPFHRVWRADSLQPAVTLAARRTGNASYELLFDTFSRPPAFVNLTAGTHRLALRWSQPGADGDVAARLVVNDLVVVERLADAPGGAPGVGLSTTLHHAFGALEAGAARWALDVDALRVDAGALRPGSELVLASDFEAGSEPWNKPGFGGGGGPELSAQGALNGKNGALLELGDEERGLWHSSAPSAETAVGLRLGLLLGEGARVPAEGLTILGGSTGDSAQDDVDVFSLALVQAEGVYLEATTWTAGGSPLRRRVKLAQAQTHVVELQWYTSGPGRDGLLRLWLDGNVAGEIAQIGGPPKQLESLRLGVLGTGPGEGRVSIDDILVWRPTRADSIDVPVSLP